MCEAGGSSARKRLLLGIVAYGMKNGCGGRLLDLIRMFEDVSFSSFS
jgi:hypothetical protein